MWSPKNLEFDCEIAQNSVGQINSSLILFQKSCQFESGDLFWRTKEKKIPNLDYFLMASTIQQTKFIMDNDRIEDDISDDEIYEAIQNSLKELKVIIFHFFKDVKL